VNWQRARLLLAVATLEFGCEPLVGADFGGYRRAPDAAADMSVSDADSADAHDDNDASSTTDASTTDASSTADANDSATGDTDASVNPPDTDSSIDNGSPPPPDSSVDDVSVRDMSTVDEYDAEEVSPPPPRDGGTTGGICMQGQVHLIGPCGNCGLFLQTCNMQGTWDAPSCEQERDCAPGWKEQRSCDGNGTSTWTCTQSCTWMPGPCIQSTCMPNQTENQPCGRCGTQTRTCQATDAGGWQWSPFSSCMNENACAPTTIGREICGNCGTRSRTCDNACAWSGWSDCGGQGACAPGASETRPCLLKLTTQTRYCDENCTWGAWMGLCL